MSVGDAFTVLLVASATALGLWAMLKSGVRELDRKRSRAMDQFRATRLRMPGGQLVFDGSQAEVLETSETHYYDSYALSVRARMPDGNVYEFKYDPNDKPWVVCLSQGDGHGVRAHAPA